MEGVGSESQQGLALAGEDHVADIGLGGSAADGGSKGFQIIMLEVFFFFFFFFNYHYYLFHYILFLFEHNSYV